MDTFGAFGGFLLVSLTTLLVAIAVRDKFERAHRPPDPHPGDMRDTLPGGGGHPW